MIRQSIGNQWGYEAAGAVEMPPAIRSYQTFMSSPTMRIVGMIASGALAYHGYKRNNGSILWAAIWGVAVPNVIGLPIAFAQGFAKRK